MIRNNDKRNRFKQNILIIIFLWGIALFRYTPYPNGTYDTPPKTFKGDPCSGSMQGVMLLSMPVLLEMPIEELMEVSISP